MFRGKHPKITGARSAPRKFLGRCMVILRNLQIAAPAPKFKGCPNLRELFGNPDWKSWCPNLSLNSGGGGYVLENDARPLSIRSDCQYIVAGFNEGRDRD